MGLLVKDELHGEFGTWPAGERSPKNSASFRSASADRTGTSERPAGVSARGSVPRRGLGADAGHGAHIL
ncbi:MAG: hypothetical protein J0I21_21555, partial [Alphaproteobacteria bacterium]|nr:hypothetical protein [Alphaproteobacteria bacterium]